MLVEYAEKIKHSLFQTLGAPPTGNLQSILLNILIYIRFWKRSWLGI